MKGRFIVIEGTDGSGKTTHCGMLTEWLRTQGRPVAAYDFPRNQEKSSYFIKQYLAGNYGGLSEIGPERGSLFYALDRYDASFNLRRSLADGDTVVCGRYVLSNMGHQGSKIADAAARRRYYAWNEQLEYDILGIPRPDLNIVLLMPAKHARAFVKSRATTRDLHEADPAHHELAEQTYRELCRLYPQQYTAIECVANGVVRPLADIQNEIRKLAC